MNNSEEIQIVGKITYDFVPSKLTEEVIINDTYENKIYKSRLDYENTEPRPCRSIRVQLILNGNEFAETETNEQGFYTFSLNSQYRNQQIVFKIRAYAQICENGKPYFHVQDNTSIKLVPESKTFDVSPYVVKDDDTTNFYWLRESLDRKARFAAKFNDSFYEWNFYNHDSNTYLLDDKLYYPVDIHIGSGWNEELVDYDHYMLFSDVKDLDNKIAADSVKYINLINRQLLLSQKKIPYYFSINNGTIFRDGKNVTNETFEPNDNITLQLDELIFDSIYDLFKNLEKNKDIVNDNLIKVDNNLIERNYALGNEKINIYKIVVDNGNGLLEINKEEFQNYVDNITLLNLTDKIFIYYNKTYVTYFQNSYENSYTFVNKSSLRQGAPFFILDAIYNCFSLVKKVNLLDRWRYLPINWSINNGSKNILISDLNKDNKVDNVERSITGDIHTSFFSRSTHDIWIEGTANIDTEEYDLSIIFHEWFHYFQNVASRNDSIGGRHFFGDIIDSRVVFSEGSAYFFAAAMGTEFNNNRMIINTFGQGQNSGSGIDPEYAPDPKPGWFSEYSIINLLFDLYDKSEVKSVKKTPFEAKYIILFKKDSSFLNLENLRVLIGNENGTNRKIEINTITDLNLKDLDSTMTSFTKFTATYIKNTPLAIINLKENKFEKIKFDIVDDDLDQYLVLFSNDIILNFIKKLDIIENRVLFTINDKSIEVDVRNEEIVNIYPSDDDGITIPLETFLEVYASDDFVNSDAFANIFSFIYYFKKHLKEKKNYTDKQIDAIDQLVGSKQIGAAFTGKKSGKTTYRVKDEWGTGEKNDAGGLDILPVYKIIEVGDKLDMTLRSEMNTDLKPSKPGYPKIFKTNNRLYSHKLFRFKGSDKKLTFKINVESLNQVKLKAYSKSRVILRSKFFKYGEFTIDNTSKDNWYVLDIFITARDYFDVSIEMIEVDDNFFKCNNFTLFVEPNIRSQLTVNITIPKIINKDYIKFKIIKPPNNCQITEFKKSNLNSNEFFDFFYFNVQPNRNFIGIDEFEYQASSSQTGRVIIYIYPNVNDPKNLKTIVRGDVAGNARVNNIVSGFLDAFDWSGLENDLAFRITQPPKNKNSVAEIDPIKGFWTYKPETNWIGSDTFEVSIRDDDGYITLQQIVVVINSEFDKEVRKNLYGT